ncbi:carbohydrate-binding module family 18 protein [Piromyces sp. E2]|nr:carbohydrate-binding module family 18 protein [Piromyces sp. E2]|eukprot:OUM65069.1 carbohydrate-binding module family 18 protein [Piromyces sp. E2]
MFKKTLLNLLLIANLISISFQLDATAFDTKFTEDIPCKIVGNSGMKLFENTNVLFKSYNGHVLKTKIGDSKESIPFYFDYCECYMATGACRVSLLGNDSNYNYKIVLDLILEKYDEFINVTSKQFFQSLEESEKIKNRYYCNVKHTMYISSLFQNVENGDLVSVLAPGFPKPEDIVLNDPFYSYRIPLFYNAEADYGDTKDEKNGKEYILAVASYYRIDGVTECASKKLSFSSLTVNNKYQRKNHDKYHQFTSCTWGTQYVDTESNSNVISTDPHSRCGSAYGRCPDNKCCSKYGYCGTTSEYCGNGCKSEFGRCE